MTSMIVALSVESENKEIIRTFILGAGKLHLLHLGQRNSVEISKNIFRKKNGFMFSISLANGRIGRTKQTVHT